MKVTTQQGETLDALCWRCLGRTAGAVEAALDANPGLADLGPVLPHGQVIFLPDAPLTPQKRPLLQLWD